MNVEVKILMVFKYSCRLVDQFTELQLRFEKAVNEIKALKKEIRDIQNQHDDIELSNLKLRQDLKGSEGDFNSQLNLMTCRIQDLTNKLTASEKQVYIIFSFLSLFLISVSLLSSISYDNFFPKVYI